MSLCINKIGSIQQPIIIMGTSALVSWYRMNKRTAKKNAINGLKKLFLFISNLNPEYIKKYIKDEKKLQDLKKNLNTDNNLSENSNINKKY